MAGPPERAYFPVGLPGKVGKVANIVDSSLIGQCHVFPAPLAPIEHFVRGVACVKEKECLRTQETTSKTGLGWVSCPPERALSQ